MAAVRDRIAGWRSAPPKVIHRESFTASVLNHSGNQTCCNAWWGKVSLDNVFALIEGHPKALFGIKARPPARSRSSKLGCRTTSRRFPSQLHLPVRSRLCRPRPLCSSRVGRSSSRISSTIWPRLRLKLRVAGNLPRRVDDEAWEPLRLRSRLMTRLARLFEITRAERRTPGVKAGTCSPSALG